MTTPLDDPDFEDEEVGTHLGQTVAKQARDLKTSTAPPPPPPPPPGR
ncbi:hypothetical protein [Amycolatopsis jejuensis]|nr:hypothetical protein [Amycolatopsis jejuensis]